MKASKELINAEKALQDKTQAKPCSKIVISPLKKKALAFDSSLDNSIEFEKENDTVEKKIDSPIGFDISEAD